ncbi:hypothetical protein [Microcoleus asticus]|uniref:Transposase n=1 Tax=Microcoleus asticus IPMA8 TaxID=2563858 RepID=A0ABX2CSW3_9CYAN|nr:hypothetical protein [Microcoleus asticus]NQE32777.1 hypothetical protein [Microcoleus asticus IPMA8]
MIKKQHITGGLDTHRAEITSGKLVVFLQDEYHLLSELMWLCWG